MPMRIVVHILMIMPVTVPIRTHAVTVTVARDHIPMHLFVMWLRARVRACELAPAICHSHPFIPMPHADASPCPYHCPRPCQRHCPRRHHRPHIILVVVIAIVVAALTTVAIATVLVIVAVVLVAVVIAIVPIAHLGLHSVPVFGRRSQP